MAARPPTPPADLPVSLTVAIVKASTTPALLLDGDLTVVALSDSFARVFQLDAAEAEGGSVAAMGTGQWDLPRLRSLLEAVVGGAAGINDYEMDFRSPALGPRLLVLNACRLEYGDGEEIRVLLSADDVTVARANDKLKDDMLREKAILLREVHHRVANSLQIIASVLLQNARNVNSEESRSHLTDAHQRVISFAAVQRHLTSASLGEVELRPYLVNLCRSLDASMVLDRDRLQIEVRADDSTVEADASVSIGLIVTELVINALKHAFPGHRGGRILIDFHSDAPGWVLSVSDNGVGMLGSAPPAKAGLGTSIIEAVARQLHAEITVTDNQPGAKVTLTHTRPDPRLAAGAPAELAV